MLVVLKYITVRMGDNELNSITVLGAAVVPQTNLMILPKMLEEFSWQQRKSVNTTIVIIAMTACVNYYNIKS